MAPTLPVTCERRLLLMLLHRLGLSVRATGSTPVWLLLRRPTSSAGAAPSAMVLGAVCHATGQAACDAQLPMVCCVLCPAPHHPCTGLTQTLLSASYSTHTMLPTSHSAHVLLCTPHSSLKMLSTVDTHMMLPLPHGIHRMFLCSTYAVEV